MGKENLVEPKKKSAEVRQKEQTRTENKKTFKVKRLKRNDLIAKQEKTKLWHKYKKMMRKEGRNVNDGKSKTMYEESDSRVSRGGRRYEESDEEENEEEEEEGGKFSKRRQGFTANKRAQIEYENKMKQKEKEKEEREKKQLEKVEALKKYKKTKKDKFHKLCNKNKKGQALMGKQVDLLLKKIQANK